MYNFKCQNVYLYLSLVDFCFLGFRMSEHIFVLSGKNSDLSFQKKKIELQP